MVNNGAGRQGPWGQLVLIALGLIVAVIVVSFVLSVIKAVVYAALLLIAGVIVLRAVRGRR